MAIRTRRWTRSPRGRMLGVATGLAEWKGFPEDTTRLIFAIITICTGVVPMVPIYLLLAVILPEQTDDDLVLDGEKYSSSRSRRRSSSYSSGAEDATYREKSREDLEKEYEELKKKVEAMENDIFNKEKEWDERFRNETKD